MKKRYIGISIFVMLVLLIAVVFFVSPEARSTFTNYGAYNMNCPNDAPESFQILNNEDITFSSLGQGGFAGTRFMSNSINCNIYRGGSDCPFGANIEYKFLGWQLGECWLVNLDYSTIPISFSNVNYRIIDEGVEISFDVNNDFYDNSMITVVYSPSTLFFGDSFILEKEFDFVVDKGNTTQKILIPKKSIIDSRIDLDFNIRFKDSEFETYSDSSTGLTKEERDINVKKYQELGLDCEYGYNEIDRVNFYICIGYNDHLEKKYSYGFDIPVEIVTTTTTTTTTTTSTTELMTTTTEEIITTSDITTTTDLESEEQSEDLSLWQKIVNWFKNLFARD